MAIKLISNLIYALRKRLGWCPEPPTPKTIVSARMALNHGMARMKKPPISLGNLIAPVNSIGGALIIWLLTQYAISIVPPGEREAAKPIFSFIYFMIYFILIYGFIMPIPFILKREIDVTKNKFHVRFGFFQDNIPFYDIESIEPIKRKPLMFFGTNWASDPSSWLTTLWGFFIIGVAKIKGVKWYVFKMGHSYLKINKRNGDSVCVSLKNPELLLEEFTRNAPDIKIIRKACEEISEKEPKELYEELLHAYVSIYGGGRPRLEKMIASYIRQGLSRDEAIRKLAEKEKLILQS